MADPLELAANTHIAVGDECLQGDLALPPKPSGVVLFAHESGSSRHSPRNRYVARTLQGAGLGTLLIDLLSPSEEETDRRTAHFRFDIPLLASRLITVIDWLGAQADTRDLPMGLFGAS